MEKESNSSKSHGADGGVTGGSGIPLGNESVFKYTGAFDAVIAGETVSEKELVEYIGGGGGIDTGRAVSTMGTCWFGNSNAEVVFRGFDEPRSGLVGKEWCGCKDERVSLVIGSCCEKESVVELEAG